MSNYIFLSEAEIERLQLQARVWEPAAEAMLEVIDPQPGWACADLGCGAMGILRPLSRRVGPGGRVVGVEKESAFLAAVHAYISNEELGNVEVLERDAHHSGLPRGSFDLVHERFVLPHVPSPEAMLAEMLSLAKPGGIVAVQEPDHSSWNFYPPNPTWPRLRRLLEEAIALTGDINIGRRTYLMLRQAGLEAVTIRAAVVALQDHHPYMRLPVIAGEAMRKLMVGAGLVSDAELDDLLEEVEICVANPETFVITFTVTQVWGRKPV